MIGGHRIVLAAAAAVVAAAVAASGSAPGSAHAAANDCRPLRAVFYAESNWLQLAKALAANASPCAQYYVSVPPLAADKTALRTNQAQQIRALGPAFHALAEFNYGGWSTWVTAGNGSWYDAGVAFRQRMAAAGFDVNAGDTWALNELSSGVRGNAANARQNVEDLLRGLYDAGGNGAPAVKGVVFDIGMAQSSSSLAAYKTTLASWLLDSTFWQAMSSYVSDFAQESYGDVRAYAVAGAPADERVQYLEAYFAHPLALVAAGPGDVGAARSFLQQAYEPLGNAAWVWDSAFGYTDVPLQQMQDFVTAQVVAARTLGQQDGWPTDRFGFAWAPRLPSGTSSASQFSSDTAALLGQLAAAIHDSDQAPNDACGTSWCTSAVPGAAFTQAWSTFSTWPFQLAVPAPPQVGVGQPTQLAVQLLTNGAQQAVAAPLQVTLATSSAGAGFATSAAGPFVPTLTVTIPAGDSAVPFFYDDPNVGTATLTASGFGALAASQAVTVAAAPPPDLRVALAASSKTAPLPGGALSFLATVTNASPTASTAATLQLTLPPGYSVGGTSGATCTPAGQTLSCALPPVGATPVQVAVTGTVGTAAEQDVSALVTSTTPPEPSPTDNTASLAVPPAPLKALKPPRVAGRAVVGSTLHAVAPRWNRTPTRVTVIWQTCASGRCTSMRGATAPHLKLRTVFRRRWIRVLVTATYGTQRVEVGSRSVRVR